MADNAPAPVIRSTAALSMGQTARRIGLLRSAVAFLGQERAAEALDIQPRSLRAKLEASRGVHDDNLRLIATALERHAADVAAHAATVRAALDLQNGAA